MKWLIRPLLIFFLLILSSSPVSALTFPKPTGYVNDFADMYSAGFEQALESELAAFEKETTAEIAVVTVKDIQETTIDDYAVRLYEDWKIGKEKEDNGVLLLIAKTEREVRIEVGYGLEAGITDSQAGRIIRNDITPRFKASNYEGGTRAGVTSLQTLIRGEPIPQTNPQQPALPDAEALSNFAPFLLFGLTYFGSYMARSKEFIAGGVAGGVLGAVAGAVIGTPLAMLVAAVLLGSLGLGLDYVLSRNYRQRREHHLPTDWWHSGGGFFGGSKSSGGGFGGFGGGSSGGGGASGRW